MTALNEPWFQVEFSHEINNNDLHFSCLEKINTFHKPFAFTQRVLELLVKYLPNAQIEKFKNIFNALDKKKIGFISVSDLEKVMKQLELKVNENQIAKIGTKRYDKYLKSSINNDLHNPVINFSNFILAVIDRNIIDSKPKLMEVFKVLDTNKTGQLTIQSVQKAFERTGKKTSLDEVRRMIEEIGFEEHQTMNFDIFYQIVSQDI